MPDSLPAPLTPPDCDLRTYYAMPLHLQRFRDSDLVTQEDPETVLAAIMLWSASWHQLPAASLPADDRALAKFAGYGRSLAAWHNVKEGALRGFILCSDGRLYHEVVAEFANESWDKRLSYVWGKAKDRHRKAMLKLPEDERSEFVDFDDWKAGRTPIERPHRQSSLPLERAEPSAGKDQGEAPVRPHDRARRARTGASSVPSALSTGTDPSFHRNDPPVPLETPLKGKEGNRTESKSSHPTPSDASPPCADAREAPDLKRLHAAVCDAAGYFTVDPAAIDASMAQVRRWVDRGLDFDNVVLPAIRSVVANSSPSDRTRTLGRFRHAIAREEAKAAEARSNGRAHVPTASPILEPEGEDERFRPIRAALLERLGPHAYTHLLNPVRIEAVPMEFGDERQPLRFTGPDHAVRSIADNHAGVVKAVAKPHGFTDLW